MAEKMSGFTFLELMICISIIALVFTAVFQFQTRNIALADAMKFKSSAARLAQQKLSEIAINSGDLSEQEGTFEEPFQSYSYLCSTREYETVDEDLLSEKRSGKLKRIDVTVSRDRQSMTLSSWRYFPDDTP